MREKIEQAVKKAFVSGGSRKVKVTFREDSARMVSAFLEMVTVIVEMDKKEETILIWVGETGKWECDKNRTAVLTLLIPFDMTRFLGKMTPLLENIEVV